MSIANCFQKKLVAFYLTFLCLFYNSLFAGIVSTSSNIKPFKPFNAIIDFIIFDISKKRMDSLILNT